MKYDAYAYLYPPRPEAAISIETVTMYERMGHWAQIKRNGDCTMIFSCDDQVIFKNRHNQDPTRWTPKEHHINFFRGRLQWNVYVAERVDDTLYLFDQIVKDGVQLVGSTFKERQQIIHSNWTGVEEDYEVRITPWLTVAKSMDRNFAKVFKTLGPKDEGLVIKRPDANLNACFRDKQNGGGQVKARILTKNYSF